MDVRLHGNGKEDFSDERVGDGSEGACGVMKHIASWSHAERQFFERERKRPDLHHNFPLDFLGLLLDFYYFFFW